MHARLRVLLVDDDEELRQLVGAYLERNGFDVDAVGDGAAMRASWQSRMPDVVLLDVMLPGESGLALCRELRERQAVPVIMLTALGDEVDRVLGLEMGADDYVVKPFSPRELLARVRARLRGRRAPLPGPPLGRAARFAGWTLDLIARHLVSPDGVVVALSGAEFRMLAALLQHPRVVLPRERLAELAQCSAKDAHDRAVDLVVSRLRRRVGVDRRFADLILTVRQEGYVLAADVAYE